VFTELFDEHFYNEGFSIRPVLLHPQTHGFVRLRSRNPHDHPLIDPNYLADPLDVKMLIEGEMCVEVHELQEGRSVK
jgi:choline dehydrogenase-like flavoprotein